MNNIRSFANSYLYTRIPDYEKHIFEFVMKAERINKRSDSFSGIVEDVKRRQTTAVLSRVLARDDVVLCINSKPLPASFKVFACKDVKENNTVKVFIDMTGLISLKNGYFVINKIDVFCSYLMSAMTYIAYNAQPTKITNNSALIQSGTECFMDLANHVFDYLRPSGYNENRNKIAYIMCMYYQCTLLGLNREDNSVKSLAAKLAGIDTRSIAAVEFLYDDEDLLNIDTLIKGIAKTFKLSGVGTDVFVEKWTWYYGVGTLFGTELFAPFATIITDAYCGAYVNNQKTIEKFCGKALVTFTNALIRACSDIIDKGFKYESAIDRDVDHKSKSTIQESVSNGFSKKRNRLYKGDIQNIDVVKQKYGNTVALESTKASKSKIANQYLDTALVELTDMVKDNKTSKYNNFVSEVADLVSKDLTRKGVEEATNDITSKLNEYSRSMADGQNPQLKPITKDLREALRKIDPSCAAVAEVTEEAIDEGTVKDTVRAAVKEKVNLKDVKEQWKAATKGFVKGRWIERYLNDADKEKVMKYYKAMCSEDISYADYKRYFKAICNFMRIPSDKVIIESIEIRKDSHDKDQDVVAMRYSKGAAKVKIPDGVRLMHVSPVENIESLIPSFRSKLTGKFLYPSKRVYFTIAKEIKSTNAGLEKTKTYRYTPKDKIEYAWIDPACPDISSRAVFVESLKPIPVVKFERAMEKIIGTVRRGGKEKENVAK